MQGLILLLPAGHEKTTCLRLRKFGPEGGTVSGFRVSRGRNRDGLDLRDYGNFDTHLEPVRRRVPGRLDAFIAPLLRKPAVLKRPLPSGEISFRVHGLEFARTSGDTLRGFRNKRPGQASNMQEIELLVGEAGRCPRTRSTQRSIKSALFERAESCGWNRRYAATWKRSTRGYCRRPCMGRRLRSRAGERGMIDLLAAARRPAGDFRTESARIYTCRCRRWIIGFA